MKTAVVAVGGNALLDPLSDAGVEAQREAASATARSIVASMAPECDLVITHGNGPQVGNLLIQNHEAEHVVPPLPLDVCVAESQAQIGYLMQMALRRALREADIPRNVTCIITQVVVDPEDPAFQNPTKPVGPTYPREYAKTLMRERGWILREDPRGGFRRVVPSPEPLEIVEMDTIGRLLWAGAAEEVVIAAGGGGIPVVIEDGGYAGIEAVVDKDLTSSLLALGLGADDLLLITDVDRAYLDYGGDHQKGLDTITPEEAHRHHEEGQFPPGSMGPKVRAAADFVQGGGSRAIITSIDNLHAALNGEAGTTVTRT